MKRTILAISALTMAAGLMTASSQAANESASNSFDAFKIILERNIFDPNRIPLRAAIGEPDAAAPTPVPVESIDLLGSWMDQGRRVAFIEGSSAPGNGQLTPGETLDGWRVESIDTAGVVLIKKDRRINWKVGQRLERGAGEDWRLSTETIVRQGPSSTSEADHQSRIAPPTAQNEPPAVQNGSATVRSEGRSGRSEGRAGRKAKSVRRTSGTGVAAPAASPPAGAPASSSSEDDVIKRLMEKRQKETKGE